jgi:ribosomal protein L21
MSEIEKFKDKDSFLETFANLRPDFFLPDSFTDEQKAEVKAELVRPHRTKTSMFASIPMRCEGSKCVVADTCPLLKKNIAPIGNPCPIELNDVQTLMVGYMQELNVDSDNLVEVSMVRDLVDQEIQYIRKSRILAKEHFIQENVIGIDDNGNPIMKKELHLAVELEDKLHKRRKDLRNQLMATREAKAKIGQGALDTAQVLANVFEQVAEVKIEQEKLLRQKLGISDRDDYIHDAILVDPLELEE